MSWPAIKRQFGPVHFWDWLKAQPKPTWKPQFVVLHNTATPSLAQRPQGFTAAHMANLEQYYKVDQGWKSGPHLFVDQNGVWLFSDLNARGTHSPSWNAIAFGVEMLGDYNRESFESGPGLNVHRNAVIAVAALHAWAGIDTSTLKLHKEDPKTTHDCPGSGVDKAAFIRAIHAQKLAFLGKN